MMVVPILAVLLYYMPCIIFLTIWKLFYPSDLGVMYFYSLQHFSIIIWTCILCQAPELFRVYNILLNKTFGTLLNHDAFWHTATLDLKVFDLGFCHHKCFGFLVLFITFVIVFKIYLSLSNELVQFLYLLCSKTTEEKAIL